MPSFKTENTAVDSIKPKVKNQQLYYYIFDLFIDI
jgi:hypothetical protein